MFKFMFGICLAAANGRDALKADATTELFTKRFARLEIASLSSPAYENLYDDCCFYDVFFFCDRYLLFERLFVDVNERQGKNLFW
jgi:hypothetical protein